jgi:hypothetical protein
VFIIICLPSGLESVLWILWGRLFGYCSNYGWIGEEENTSLRIENEELSSFWNFLYDIEGDNCFLGSFNAG